MQEERERRLDPMLRLVEPTLITSSSQLRIQPYPATPGPLLKVGRRTKSIAADPRWNKKHLQNEISLYEKQVISEQLEELQVLCALQPDTTSKLLNASILKNNDFAFKIVQGTPVKAFDRRQLSPNSTCENLATMGLSNRSKQKLLE